jgi:hypothetical protein
MKAVIYGKFTEKGIINFYLNLSHNFKYIDCYFTNINDHIKNKLKPINCRIFNYKKFGSLKEIILKQYNNEKLVLINLELFLFNKLNIPNDDNLYLLNKYSKGIISGYKNDILQTFNNKSYKNKYLINPLEGGNITNIYPGGYNILVNIKNKEIENNLINKLLYFGNTVYCTRENHFLQQFNYKQIDIENYYPYHDYIITDLETDFHKYPGTKIIISSKVELFKYYLNLQNKIFDNSVYLFYNDQNILNFYLPSLIFYQKYKIYRLDNVFPQYILGTLVIYNEEGKIKYGNIDYINYKGSNIIYSVNNNEINLKDIFIYDINYYTISKYLKLKFK